MSGTLFRTYDQEGLDAQYNLRARHPDFQDHFDKWARDSAQARGRLKGQLDLAYGVAPGETLDVFPAARAKAPVHVFVHGGYWRALDKKDHSFVAPVLVAEGYAAVVVNYALAPSVGVDEIVHQVRNAIAWTYRNAARIGADPDRITMSGHSAGGHLTAMAALTDWPRFAPDLPGDLVKAAGMVSGLFDLEPIRHSYLNADLRLDAESAARNSPLRFAPPASVPLLVAVGAGETEEFLRQSRELAQAWRGRAASLRHVEIPGHNHFEIVEGLADSGAPLTQALLELIGKV
jgi:arylformamidase